MRILLSEDCSTVIACRINLSVCFMAVFVTRRYRVNSLCLISSCVVLMIHSVSVSRGSECACEPDINMA